MATKQLFPEVNLAESTLTVDVPDYGFVTFHLNELDQTRIVSVQTEGGNLTLRARLIGFTLLSIPVVGYAIDVELMFGGYATLYVWHCTSCFKWHAQLLIPEVQAYMQDGEFVIVARDGVIPWASNLMEALAPLLNRTHPDGDDN